MATEDSSSINNILQSVNEGGLMQSLHNFNFSSALQIVTVIGILGFAYFLANHNVRHHTGIWYLASLRKVFHLRMSRRETLFLCYSLPILWLTDAALKYSEQEAKLVHAATSLITAWGIIRISSGIIRNPVMSRFIAIVLWIVAALSILDLLSPVKDILDSIGVNFGAHRITVLAVIKTVFVFAVLIWLAGLLTEVLDRSLHNSKSLTPSQKVLFHKITKIILVALAVVVSLNAAGIDLTALAVFSGALGFGIGFGLQKVFSNLLSGIILLLDKSVKPGDVIAIGGTFGWVNTLSARCISVITRDGKEHLIPNEQLITEKVENWSYSHNKVRIHVPIGVSYKADIHKVRKLMLDAANAHPRILQEPEATCIITGFGDSSVNFEIRCWLENPINGIDRVKSDIYFNIWDAFKKHQIEIPFPQRDLHIKSVSQDVGKII